MRATRDDSPASPAPEAARRARYHLGVTETRQGAAPHVRTANKAIIRDEAGRLLVNAMVDRATGAPYYLPPGGGQEWGEDRIEGLKRECREEIGCDVEVLGLACLRSYIGRNHPWAEHDGWFHQEEAYWFCRLDDGAVPGSGSLPDTQQVGVVWKSVAELRQPIGEGYGRDTGMPSFSPMPLLDWLEADPATRPLYLGDVI